MKFMKLGSKPDSFQNDGDNVRYVISSSLLRSLTSCFESYVIWGSYLWFVLFDFLPNPLVGFLCL